MYHEEELTEDQHHDLYKHTLRHSPGFEWVCIESYGTMPTLVTLGHAKEICTAHTVELQDCIEAVPEVVSTVASNNGHINTALLFDWLGYDIEDLY